MRKLIQYFLCVAVLLMALPSARAFIPGGPIANGGDSWQIPDLGYGLAGDLNAPKNIGEEYRRNVPYMYYAYDANFFGFFGLAGATNVDTAYALMNGVLNGMGNTPLFVVTPDKAILGTNGLYNGINIVLGPTNNLDSYSPDLSEFSIESIQYNNTMAALGLTDLKSITLLALVEQMGLTDPVRYNWTLHDIYQPPGTTCPDSTTFIVVQRNLDYVNSALNQVQYTPYINDTLYYYQIVITSCSGPQATTVPKNVDPFAGLLTPVASPNSDILGKFAFLFSTNGLANPFNFQSSGGFYAGLTRDDVAGLRYLMTSNNINTESTSINGSLLLTTNVQPPQVFGPTLPISLLLSSSLTNDPNQLAANYPGITYLSVITNIVNQISTNITAYFTNLPGPYTNRVPLSNNAAIYPAQGNTVPFTNWSPVQFGDPPVLLSTLPLLPFLTQAQTSSPAALSAAYPNLLFGSVYTNFYSVQVTTNTVAYFTNLAGPYTNRVSLSNNAAIYPAQGSTVPFTNWSPVQFSDPPILLTTQPLRPLLALSQVLDPITLQGLFPGLLVDKVVTNFFAVDITTNIDPYYTNQIVLPTFNTFSNGLPYVTTLTNIYLFTNQPGPTVVNYNFGVSPTSISTLDLGLFSDRSATNDAATMIALYPGLVIQNSYSFPGFVSVTNYISYLTNYLGAPYQGPPTLITKAISTNFVFTTNWVHVFANVFTNHVYPNRNYRVTSIWITNIVGAPYGSPFIGVTNTVVYKTNLVSGDFFILPTNWCGFDLRLTLPLGNPGHKFGSTNTYIYPGYNADGSVGTNATVGGTAFGLTKIFYNQFTNFQYAVYPGVCQPVLAFGVSYSTNPVLKYDYNFINVVTNHYFTNSYVSLFVTNVYAIPNNPTNPLIVLRTNIVNTNYYTNLAGGDFYIVPTNWCGYQIVALLTNLIAPTNILITNQNFGSGVSNIAYSYVRYLTYTNYTYSIRPGVCEPALAFTTSYATNIVNSYQYDFLNVVTNGYSSSNLFTLVVTNQAAVTNGLVGMITNLITANTFYSNTFNGDFYIVPTNWCGYQIIGLLRSNVVVTNTTFATNAVGVTTLPGQAYSVTLYSVISNTVYSIRPGVCEPALAFSTNYSTNITAQYNYYFGNIVTNRYYTNGTATTVTTNKAIWTNGLVGMLTNIVSSSVISNLTGGDFYIIPPNFCGFTILSTQLTTAILTTNVFAATNLPGVQDLGQQFTQTTISGFTNYTFKIQPSICSTVAAPPLLREGIQRAQFIRANYDSLLSQFFTPITNNYTMTKVTNSQPVKEYYQRVIIRPDFLMSARDQGTGGGHLLSGPHEVPVDAYFTRNLPFDQSTILTSLAGPGVIFPTTQIDFNKAGRAYYNISPSFMGYTNAAAQWQWASYDASTNDPVLYPNGTDLQNLANQIYIQVTPTTAADGTNGVPYIQTVPFAVTGGQPPFVWAAPNISALVPGMSFNPTNANNTAKLIGTPTAAGVFNFNLQVTDSVNRTVNLNYTITIH